MHIHNLHMNFIVCEAHSGCVASGIASINLILGHTFIITPCLAISSLATSMLVRTCMHLFMVVIGKVHSMTY